MRVLYFYQYFGTTKGSWSTRVYEFARRWVQAGDSVTVVTSVYDKSDLRSEAWLSQLEIDGIDVRVINLKLSNKHGFLARIWSFCCFAVVACWYALVLPADVVVASSGPITIGLPGLVARYVRRKPLVFEVRDLWPEGAIQLGVLRNRLLIAVARWFERFCYRSASRIVVLSKGMRDWIGTHHGHECVEVIPNVSDNHLFGPGELNGNGRLPAWAHNKHLALYTGSLGLMDDCSQLLEMAKCLRSEGDGIEVVLIGDGTDKSFLEARAAEAGLDNLHFMGLMQKEEVANWLRHARCALLAFKAVPAMDTVSPNKMFDAFASGVPVVQATQGWIKDLLHDEQCGVTVDAGDAKAMAEAVRSLTRDDELHRRLADNAKRVAREMFDCDRLARQMRMVLIESANNYDGRQNRNVPAALLAERTR